MVNGTNMMIKYVKKYQLLRLYQRMDTSYSIKENDSISLLLINHAFNIYNHIGPPFILVAFDMINFALVDRYFDTMFAC